MNIAYPLMMTIKINKANKKLDKELGKKKINCKPNSKSKVKHKNQLQNKNNRNSNKNNSYVYLVRNNLKNSLSHHSATMIFSKS